MGLLIENSRTFHAQTGWIVFMFSMLPNEIFGKIIDKFTRTTKEASVQSEFEPEKIYFNKRYSKPVNAKENTDVRLEYRMDINTFLVKAYSTFGVGTVLAN
ncbi:hypothetical protein CEXT_768121 [Caerostris extrusa]|uniref:Uncharacterized protein n=1 Tax=Caerostris extrusa TaxID=172846 RepID=A0AAV4NVZ3_CAEEX|nr:hypothetical protein CEXT_768121 [Caerostris extrusa]